MGIRVALTPRWVALINFTLNIPDEPVYKMSKPQFTADTFPLLALFEYCHSGNIKS